MPHITKPSVASKLARVEHPVACPPQWLPVLLAASSLSPTEALSTSQGVAAATRRSRQAHERRAEQDCRTPRWVIGNVNSFASHATMIPAIVTLNGVQIGSRNPDGTRSPCDQLASIGAADGIVRGVSSHIPSGFSVPIIGNAGEMIEFRYWNAAEGKEYFSEYRYSMVAAGQVAAGQI